MPRKLDPLWEFGELDGEFDRLNLSCKLCGQHISGEVYRLKYHLAQIFRHDVGPCKNTNAEIIRRAMKSMEELMQERVAKVKVKKQLAGRVLGSGEYGSGTSSISASMSTTNPVATSSFSVPRTTASSQPSITSMLKKRRKNKLTSCWASFSFEVIFLSALQGIIHFSSLLLMLLQLLTQGTKSLLMTTLEVAFFKMKRLTAPKDWRSLGHRGHKQDAL